MLHKTHLSRIVLLSALTILAACEDPKPVEDALVIVSPAPDSVPENIPSIVGRVSDFITDERLSGTIISTFPPTTILRTNALGEFVLTEGIFPGRLYEVRAEANGYTPSVVPVRAETTRITTLTFTLVPDDRAMPLLTQPAALIFTPDLHQATLTATNTDDKPLDLTVDAPPWLTLASSPTLPPASRTPLTFDLVPDALADALDGLTAGKPLEGSIRLQDQHSRVTVLYTLVIPPSPRDLILDVESPEEATVQVGQTATFRLRARYLDAPLVGALLDLQTTGDASPTLDPTPLRTDADGLVNLSARAEATGTATLRVALVAFPDAEPVELTLTATPPDAGDDPCTPDPDGNNACGTATFWSCTRDDDGEPVCDDLDECEPNDNGANACGDARFWTCTNREGAPPSCEDLDECESDNGGCGEAATVQCVNQPGLPPTCHVRSGCTPDPQGNNDCGIASRWTCIPGEDGAVDCIDLDECDTNNGGCGDPRYWACTNNPGLPPACEDRDECEPDAASNNVCGDADRWACVNRVGADPTCIDLDECEPGEDGNNACGAPAFWACMNREGIAPVCNDLNECTPEAGGNNACGVASRWTCTNNPGAPPDCQDIDECEPDPGGRNACGIASRWTCINRQDLPPACADIDECAPDANGMNACGLTSRWTCTNRIDAAPGCDDLDECAINNGGCGDPTTARCINNTGAPPTCQTIDRCTPDQDGNNTCGPAHLFECFDPGPQGTPTCLDRDECAPGDDGRNACGDARFWTCTNNIAAPPACADINECLTNNGGCGDPAFVRCTNQLNAPPRCADLDECATNNGECGPALFWSCTNRLAAPPACADRDECRPDAGGMNACGRADAWDCTNNEGAPPTCVDLDDCIIEFAQTACGDTLTHLCTNNEGAPATCADCPTDTVNLDEDPDNGCEYACTRTGAEACNQQDDDCDAILDEGFNLRDDDESCGSCGNACAPLPGATTVACFEGTCLPLRCDEGRHDLNGDPSDGCEATLTGPTLHIDGTNTDPTPDGSADNPFRTLTAALAVAQADTRIVIRPGTYTSDLTLTTTGLTLEGDSPQTVILTSASTTMANLTLRASRITLSNLTLQGGAIGVRVDGTLSSPLQQIRLQRLIIRNIVGQDAQSNYTVAPQPAHGVVATWTSQLTVSATTISSIRGGAASLWNAGGDAPPGGAARALFLQSVSSCRIEGNTITDLDGGLGPPGSLSSGTRAGPGGDAEGIHLTNTDNCLISNNTIQDLQGGNGGNAGHATDCSFHPQRGGHATGIRLTSTTNIQALHNRVAQLTGGTGGFGGRANCTSNATTIGIALTSSTDITLDHNTTTNLRGGEAASGIHGYGGSTLGVSIDRGGDITLAHHTAWTLHQTQGRNDTAYAPGGAYCIATSNVGTVDLQHLTCARLAPGATVRYGIGLLIQSPQPGTVTLKDSIFAHINGPCISNANSANIAQIGYTNLYMCDNPEAPNTIPIGFLYNADPLFLDLDAGDLRLHPASPAINAADPDAPHDEEPAPNGCRADLGAFGQTPLATPAGNDEPHCP